MKKNLICISCPIGCNITAEYESDRIISIEGNKCKRGEAYTREELISPRRTVTAVVRTENIHIPYIPVKTDMPVLKNQIRPLLRLLYSLTLKPPVKIGDIVVSNFENSGINVVATRNVDAANR